MLCCGYTLTDFPISIRLTSLAKKYAHGFVVLCFVVVIQSFIMNSHEVFIHIHQGCFAGTGAIVRLPQCQWSKPDGYGKISQCITTTKHSKAKTICIFLGIYCIAVYLLCKSLWLRYSFTLALQMTSSFVLLSQWIHCTVALLLLCIRMNRYGDVVIGTIASQITSLMIVYSTIYSDADQRKYQSSASLAFVQIHNDRILVWLDAAAKSITVTS